MAVALGLILRDRGYSAQAIGLLLTLALGAGAVYAASTGELVRRFDRRTTLVAAALVMALSGVLLALEPGIVPTIVALLLGTVGAGTQEVGPFASLEQTLIADAGGQRAPSFFGHYNLIGAFAIAVGASIPSAVVPSFAPWGYAAIGALLAFLYASLPQIAPPKTTKAPISAHVSGAVERLAALFALDAFGGGIIVQSFMVYWLAVRFDASARTLGALFFAVNVVAALSLLSAAPLARRIGPIRAMVYTHLPSNLLLIAIPLVPKFEIAAAVLLLRFALSQIDVPVRQAMVMAIVAPEDRPRAAALTNAVRPAAAAFGPLLAGVTMAGASIGLPFYLAGGIKIVYDLATLAQFHHLDAELLAEKGPRTVG
jgi:MFS family permease